VKKPRICSRRARPGVQSLAPIFVGRGEGDAGAAHRSFVGRIIARASDLAKWFNTQQARAFIDSFALADAGRCLRAISLLDDLLAGRYGRPTPGVIVEVGELRRRVQGRLARVAIQVLGAPRTTLSVDGSRIAVLAGEGVLQHDVDPGLRLVRAESEIGSSEARLALRSGDIASVTLVFATVDARSSESIKGRRRVRPRRRAPTDRGPPRSDRSGS
jgi:hypothetical protein